MTPTIPDAWKPRLKQYLEGKYDDDRGHLSASDFPPGQSIRIQLPDGSHAFFRYAFIIVNDDSGEIAVFTEHCGYHIFPASGAEVEILHEVWVNKSPCDG